MPIPKKLAKKKNTGPTAARNKTNIGHPVVNNSIQVAPATIFNYAPQVKYTILLLLGFVLYVNTLQNEYALDDGGVIVTNLYVQKGIAGIKDIMTNDAFGSYLQQMGASQQLSGGRFRPFSIVLFAIEHSFFGDSPFLQHAINLVLFLATIFAIYYFLGNYLLKNLPSGDDIAFVATLLFAIHPIHTEVVANIKSSDEILSLLFILCTFIFGLKYVDEKKGRDLSLSMLFYFLALLSKEYGITLLALLPMLFYLYPGTPKGKTINYTLPYLAVVALYLFIRFAAVGIPHPPPKNVMLINNQLRVDPFYYATPLQKIATEWYCLGKYIVLLFFPYPLSSDYSYAQIPYHSFSDLSVWLSIFAYIAILIYGVKWFFRKNVLSFAVFFYLFNLFLVSNFPINVGAMLGERFAYHPSLGFVIIISWCIFYIFRKVEVRVKKIVVISLASVITLIAGAEVITRNADWKNNDTLFLTDLKNAPNSAFVNSNAAACMINNAILPQNAKRAQGLLDSSVACLYKAISVDKTFPDPYINLGLAYYHLGQLDSAKRYWDIIQYRLYPNHPNVLHLMPMLAKSYLDKARMLGSQGKPQEAIADMKLAITEDSKNPELWYNLGGAYFTVKEYDSARMAWNFALQLKPDYTEAQNGLRALAMQKIK